MFVKLQYTSAKPYAVFYRVLADIINTGTITNVATLQARMTSAGYHSSLTANFDSTYSFISRNITTTNTTAHMARPTNTNGNAYEFIIRHTVYDAATNYYVAYTLDGGTGYPLGGVGITLANPFSSSEWPVTDATTGTTVAGTPLSLTSIGNQTMYNSASPTAYTMFAFISDTACFIALNVSAYSPLGFSTLGNQNSTYYVGPSVYLQYTRRDYYNTDSNGFIPVVFNNTGRVSGGLGQTSTDFTAITNPNSATATECPMMVYNYLSGQPSNAAGPFSITGSAQPIVLGVGSRYTDIGSWFSGAIGGSTVNTSTYGSVFSTTAQSRIFSNDFTQRVYPIYPLSFRRPGTLGGSISDRTEIYLFHGDFLAGDEVVFNARTYILMPIYNLSATYRLAWAVPKE